MKNILSFFLLTLVLIPLQSSAVVFGGMETYGWELDFDKVKPEEKRRYAWFDDSLKTGFRKNSTNYSAPNIPEWHFVRKTVVLHDANGPALFAIIELLDESTIEDVKKTRYLIMSGKKGFKQIDCSEMSVGIQSCEVQLNNNSSSKTFYAAFYEWKTLQGRKFVLVVHNAQPSPDRKIVEEATQRLISLIQIK